jgi:hypothetical protein
VSAELAQQQLSWEDLNVHFARAVSYVEVRYRQIIAGLVRQSCITNDSERRILMRANIYKSHKKESKPQKNLPPPLFVIIPSARPAEIKIKIQGAVSTHSRIVEFR